MPRSISSVPVAIAGFDRGSSAPLHVQLYEHLRDLILAGQLKVGARLPSTRALASELGVSRTTVVTAYERLAGEGFIEGRVGAGTAVSEVLLRPRSRRWARDGGVLRLSRRAELIEGLPRTSGDGAAGGLTRPFETGTPALDRFPWEIWSRLVARSARRSPPSLHGYQDPAGHLPLREAVAAYLGVSRGVRCTGEQVIIVSGCHEAISLAAHVLFDPGAPVWIEEPGYLGARAALLLAGAELVPVPVDQEGIRVDAGLTRCPRPRLIYVTPPNQCPLGITLSLRRRLDLLDLARHSGAWILEDDYDGEYRYSGPPVPSLQSLDHAGSVIYAGTFNKVMFPSLRIGYLVVPESLVETFTIARRFLTRQSPMLEQLALHDFIVQGHLGRHLRRMRTLYGERRRLVLTALERRLPDCRVAAADGGMELALLLPPDVSDVLVSEAAGRRGVSTLPLSSFALTRNRRQGLLLGYACLSPQQVQRAVDALAQTLDDVRSRAERRRSG